MIEKTDEQRFITAMHDWGICYADWAGGKQIWLSDHEIIDNAVYPESGDWVVYDERGHTGFIGVSHDCWSDILPVKLTKAARKKYDFEHTEIKRSVPTNVLMKRYIWITCVFIHWLHQNGGSPFDIWKTSEEINTAYKTEASYFSNDPWLATYWLLHFGLCNDPRYNEVAKIIRALNYNETFEKARWTLAFFDKTDLTFDLKLRPAYKCDKDYSGLFLRRRANLLYLTYSQSYRGAGENIDNLWQSVSLYRKHDALAIRRMRWLCNNLKKYDLWETLASNLNAEENNNIPYISYAHALQPGNPTAGQRADDLISELISNQNEWKKFSSDWAKKILWDIRELGADNATLKSAVMNIFDGDMGNELLSDILVAIGEEPFGNKEDFQVLAEFESIFAEIKNFRSEKPETRSLLLEKADAFLTQQSDSTIAFLVDATSKRDARNVLWRFLVNGCHNNQADMISSLSPRTNIADYDLKYFFDSEVPRLIQSKDDPVYSGLLKVFLAPASKFTSDYDQERCLKKIGSILSAVVHLPGIFEELVGLVEIADPAKHTDILFEKVFRKTFNKPVDPIMALNKEQVERFLEAAVNYIHRYPKDYGKANSAIFYCGNSHAAEWFNLKLASSNFFQLFDGHLGSYGDPLSGQIKDSFEQALVLMDEINNER